MSQREKKEGLDRPHISEDPEVLGNEGHPVEGSAKRDRLMGRATRAGTDEDTS